MRLGYLLAGGALDAFGALAPGGEPFEQDAWRVRTERLLTGERYAPWWRHWCREVAPRPTLVPVGLWTKRLGIVQARGRRRSFAVGLAEIGCDTGRLLRVEDCCRPGGEVDPEAA